MILHFCLVQNYGKLLSWTSTLCLYVFSQNVKLNNWFMVSVRPSSYWYTREVAQCAREKRKSCTRHASRVLSNFPRASITRRTQANHEPMVLLKDPTTTKGKPRHQHENHHLFLLLLTALSMKKKFFFEGNSNISENISSRKTLKHENERH